MSELRWAARCQQNPLPFKVILNLVQLDMVQISHIHIGHDVRIIYGTIGTATSSTTEVEGTLQLVCDSQVVLTSPLKSNSLDSSSLLIIAMDVIDHFEVISNVEGERQSENGFKHVLS